MISAKVWSFNKAKEFFQLFQSLGRSPSSASVIDFYLVHHLWGMKLVVTADRCWRSSRWAAAGEDADVPSSSLFVLVKHVAVKNPDFDGHEVDYRHAFEIPVALVHMVGKLFFLDQLRAHFTLESEGLLH